MILLIDLDGTLTNTVDGRFKPYKDGVEETNLSMIPLMPGAKEFINKLKKDKHEPIIVSDSHPKYVSKIAEKIFNCEYISLTDKPNTQKVKKFFIDKYNKLNSDYPHIESNKNQFMVIGDTWLDIEMSRALNIPSILTTFYKVTSEEE